MWWRPAWFSLKGTGSIRGQTRGAVLPHPAFSTNHPADPCNTAARGGPGQGGPEWGGPARGKPGQSGPDFGGPGLVEPARGGLERGGPARVEPARGGFE